MLNSGTISDINNNSLAIQMPILCPCCNSNHIKNAGYFKLNGFKIPIFLCKDCYKAFYPKISKCMNKNRYDK